MEFQKTSNVIMKYCQLYRTEFSQIGSYTLFVLCFIYMRKPPYWIPCGCGILLWKTSFYYVMMLWWWQEHPPWSEWSTQQDLQIPKRKEKHHTYIGWIKFFFHIKVTLSNENILKYLCYLERERKGGLSINYSRYREALYWFKTVAFTINMVEECIPWPVFTRQLDSQHLCIGLL